VFQFTTSIRLPPGEEARFWGLVARPTKTDWRRCCWRWRGMVDASGAPVFEAMTLPVGQKMRFKAGLVAFTLIHGAPPEGASLVQRCKVVGCVNPHHFIPRKNSLLYKMAASRPRRKRGRPKKSS